MNSKKLSLLFLAAAFATLTPHNTNASAVDVLSQPEHATVVTAEGGLVWSSFLGHSDQPDEGWDITVDSTGIYVIGDHRCGSGFPATPGAYDTTCNDNYDVFVAKLSLDGSQVLWGTFLGSALYEYARGIAVDTSGVYVTGQATSQDFPTTAGAYDTTYNGGSTDVFVSKLSLDGSQLIWSTFLGGSWPSGPVTSDYPFGIDILNGYVYVCGLTEASDFPTTSGAYDTSFDGTQDGFVTKFKTDGSDLVYSTFLGGTSHEYCQSVAVDRSGQAYATGRTYSTDYPTTPGAYDTSHNGEHDAYVTKLSSDGKSLVYSTFIGGSDWDIGLDLEVDNAYHLYLSGMTESSDFPTTEGAYDRTINGRDDAFVLKLNTSGTDLQFSTFIGGQYEDRASGVQFDGFGNVYIAGDTISPNFPTTEGAFDRTHNGSWDAFLARVSGDGSLLSFSSYLGGHTWDEGHALVVDSNDYVYVTGRADSSTFPVTTGAADTTFGAFRDAFITKFVGTQMDIAATALEITQGIQDMESNMPLVANRATWARGYIKQINPDFPLDIPNVNALLYGYRDGVQIGSAEISFNSVTAQKDGGDRLELGDSFLFHVPKSWRTGTVTFELEVNLSGYGQIDEYDKTNNKISEVLTFNSVTTPCLIMVPIHLHGDEGDITYHTTDPGFGRVLAGLKRYHPIPSSISWWNQPTLYPSGHDAGAHWDLSNGLDRQTMLQRIRWRNWWNEDPEAGCHYVGMVSPDADTTKGTGEVLGLARVGGRESWVKMEDSTPDKAPAWYQEGAQTLGHELGHNKGLKHANCDGDEDDPDNAYPWPHPACAIADNDPTGYYGLTVYHGVWGIDRTVISNDRTAAAPHRAYPVMGYKRYQWVSPWEYCKLLDTAYGVTCSLWSWSGFQALERAAIQDPASLLSSEELARFEAASNYIVLGGLIDTDANTAEIQQVYQLDELPAGMQEQVWRSLANQKVFGVNGSYALVQVDQGGGVLDSQSLSLLSDDEDDGLYSFLEALPAATGVTGVQVREGSTILNSRLASDNPPTVQVVSPNGGETLSAGFLISWTASDPDDDALSFDISYSSDNGATWTLLEMGITGPTWQLPSLDAIPGTDQGRIRVLANDGFNTAMDASDGAFFVPNSPPQALIASPNDGLTMVANSLLILEAMSFDNEDGPNLGDVTWTSSIDGFLGDEREFATSGLSLGVHQVTLSVEDSDGLQGTDSVTVTVDQYPWKIYLPMVCKE